MTTAHDLDGIAGVYVRIGALLADELLAGDDGGLRYRAGWRGTIQIAADLSRGDAGVLSVADLLHHAAARLRRPVDILRLAEEHAPLVGTRPGRLLLLGMLDRVSYD